MVNSSLANFSVSSIARSFFFPSALRFLSPLSFPFSYLYFSHIHSIILSVLRFLYLQSRSNRSFRTRSSTHPTLFLFPESLAPCVSVCMCVLSLTLCTKLPSKSSPTNRSVRSVAQRLSHPSPEIARRPHRFTRSWHFNPDRQLRKPTREAEFWTIKTE